MEINICGNIFFVFILRFYFHFYTKIKRKNVIQEGKTPTYAIVPTQIYLYNLQLRGLWPFLQNKILWSLYFMLTPGGCYTQKFFHV